MNITKNQKILIGIGVVALGYYLYTKNKKETVVAITETPTVENAEMSNAGGRVFCTCKGGGRCSSPDANCTCCGKTGVETR
jgi:hypothetical protein